MLQQFLEQNRQTILDKWFNQTIQMYDPEMVRFLNKEKNQFANPVRYTLQTGLEKIYDGILHGIGTVEYRGLEEIIKLRAVQEFSPSKAVDFLFSFKKLIYAELESTSANDNSLTELYVFNEKIDTILGMAFDIYESCRNKIYEIKIAEIKSQSQRAFDLLERKKS